MKIQVDKCFVINLAESTDRYAQFISHYSSGLPLERIDAIDTRKPEIAEKYRHLVEPEKFNRMFDFDKGELRPGHTYFNSGGLGCYLSHMEFYKKCFDQNLKYAIVFEDNVVLQKEFDNELNNALTRLGDDFDICFLHCITHVGKEVKKCDNIIKKVSFITSTKAYLINVQNMKKYYSLFYPIDAHIDRIHEKLAHNGVNIYLINMNSIDYVKSTTINHAALIPQTTMFEYLPLSEHINLKRC